MSLQFDSDRIKKRIRESLGRINADADPSVLNQYRALIRKEVSFFRRSYLAAYLLMELDQRGGGKRCGDSGRDGRFYRGAQGYGAGSRKYGNEAEAAEERPRGDYPLAEEDSVKLFFSAGRSRKVFPREILGLIISKTLVAKEDIGAIRILDNYSFVQVRNTVADAIISSLNGNMFRGRPLLVNYARTRKDAEAGGGEEPPPQGAYSETGGQGGPEFESAAGGAPPPYAGDDPAPDSDPS